MKIEASEIKAQAEKEVAEEAHRLAIELEKAKIRHSANSPQRSWFPWRLRIERKPECYPMAPPELKEILKAYGWRLRWRLLDGGLVGSYYVERDT